VRDVRDEAPVLALGPLEAGDGRREGIGHPVELRGESGELVGATGGHPCGQVAAGDPRRRAAAVADGPEDAPRHEARGGQGERDGDQRRDDQAHPELAQRAFDRRRGEDEVEVRTAAAGPARDDERVLAGHRLPRVGEPAPRDAGADRLGQLVDGAAGQVERRGAVREGPVAVVDDRLDAAPEPKCLVQAARRV
jgi:hypothetical protein